MAGAEAEELAVLEDAEQGAEFANMEDLAGLGIPEELLEMERKYRSMKHDLGSTLLKKRIRAIPTYPAVRPLVSSTLERT